MLESNASEQSEDRSITAMGILNTLEIICSVLENQAEVHSTFVLHKHNCSFHSLKPPQPLYSPLSRTTRMSRCQKKASSGFYGAREDITRGRHTDNPYGRHSVRTNQQSTSINPPIFMPVNLPVVTLRIYPGLGQAQDSIPPRPGLLIKRLVIINVVSGILCCGAVQC